MSSKQTRLQVSHKLFGVDIWMIPQMIRQWIPECRFGNRKCTGPKRSWLWLWSVLWAWVFWCCWLDNIKHVHPIKTCFSYSQRFSTSGQRLSPAQSSCVKEDWSDERNNMYVRVCMQLTKTNRDLQQEVSNLRQSLVVTHQQRDFDIAVSCCFIVTLAHCTKQWMTLYKYSWTCKIHCDLDRDALN